MNRRSKPNDINATERAALALSLRKQGYTLDEIARQCGYKDRSGPYHAIQRELARIPVPDALDLRKIEMERMDDMLKACYAQATGGNLWAIDRVIAISKRRSEITGLDVQSDELLAGQNYVKRVILTHTAGEPSDAAS